ncbi:RICIN domain-containing protein [Nostoc punctiforme FACHB-252]|uniref:RICIN domain-containing protein n=1 Tax=Nostoc punctiforme FACHB-252 TaxID=1357509 RepID=A0ABR8HL25_NOSPU|nr:RICIN domain-containing protein [Nostoc punctiforme]MBD2616586.1 RICIN domain-containing protein [Nostoc punctiforme FACHB-252]
MSQVIQSELLVELSTEQQQFLSGGALNDAYVEYRNPTAEAQKWRLVPVGDGSYFIENVRLTRERGNSMVLDYRG